MVNKMKKLLVLGGFFLSIFLCLGMAEADIPETQIPLYALDGRVEYFKVSEVDAQLTVGWYTEPVQVLYAADGRSEVFKQSEVPAQLTVGWYETREEALNVNISSKITASDIADLANVMHSEANGLVTREVAMVAWCVLNRVDVGQGTIHSICNSNQFTRKGNKTQYAWLAEDVLRRYYLEKSGVENVGRVLPKNYLYFTGDGKHNYFRSSFRGSKVLYFPELTNPYE